MYTGHPPTWAQGMWFHLGSYSGFSANGVTSGSNNCFPANDPLSLSVVCHENGHMIGEEVTVTGGTAPYTYNWSDGCTTASCTNLCVNTYTVTIKDKIGCMSMANSKITEPPAFI